MYDSCQGCKCNIIVYYHLSHNVVAWDVELSGQLDCLLSVWRRLAISSPNPAVYGSFCKYRRASYHWSLGISPYLELFCLLSFITSVLPDLCPYIHRWKDLRIQLKWLHFETNDSTFSYSISLGLVFIWSYFVSCLLLLLFYLTCALVFTDGKIYRYSSSDYILRLTIVHFLIPSTTMNNNWTTFPWYKFWLCFLKFQPGRPS